MLSVSPNKPMVSQYLKELAGQKGLHMCETRMELWNLTVIQSIRIGTVLFKLFKYGKKHRRILPNSIFPFVICSSWIHTIYIYNRTICTNSNNISFSVSHRSISGKHRFRFFSGVAVTLLTSILRFRWKKGWYIVGHIL